MAQRYFQLSKMMNYAFATYKGKPKAKQNRSVFINNSNLNFIDEKYHLQILPAYPQLSLSGQDMLSINSNRVVLYLKFNQKSILNVIIPITKEQRDSRTTEDKSFSFKYHQLTEFLEVETNSDHSVQIVKKKKADPKSPYQSLLVQDNQKNEKVTLTLRQGDSEQQAKSTLNTPLAQFTFEYWQYRTLQLLLKKSLYELSGAHLIQQLKRLEDMGEFSNDAISLKKIIQRQVSQFYD